MFEEYICTIEHQHKTALRLAEAHRNATMRCVFFNDIVDWGRLYNIANYAVVKWLCKKKNISIGVVLL